MAQAVAASGTAPEGRNRLMIVAAVVFGLIFAVLLFTALQSRDGGSSSSSVVPISTADTLVVTRDVEANTILTEDMLAIQAVPVEQALTGGYETVEAAVGLPVRFPLQAGEQVTDIKLALSTIQDEDDLALILAPGERAFAVETSEISAVGGNLLPGNLVDVIAVFEGETPEETVTRTVLQNVTVLAIAQEALEPVPASAAAAEAEAEAEEIASGIQGQRSSEVERQPGARSVTLAVNPEQAQLLAALQSQSGFQIWLALRPVDDTEELGLPGTNLSPFFSPQLQ